MTTPAEVALLRLAAQRLVGPVEVPVQAVGWLTALQAQDLPGALVSVALRTRARSVPDVVAALDAGLVVRSWPLRGTLHLVAAQDLAWLLDLCAPRVVRGSAGRHRQLGLDAAQLDRAAAVAVEALSGGRLLARAGLFAAWAAAGVSPEGQRGVHLLRHLSLCGVTVLGPMVGAQQQVALLDEWVPSPRRLERDEALGELAVRYFRSHGPAPLADLVRWAQLTVTDARAALALARPHLEAVDVDGTEHLLDPATPGLLAAARAAADGVLLLPGFDELVLGHGDRSAVVAPEHADRVVPGGNGMFLRTVVVAGRAVGTWAPDRRGGLAATPFTAFPPGVEAALPAAYADLPR